MKLQIDKNNEVELYAISDDYIRILPGKYVPLSVKYDIRGTIRRGDNGHWEAFVSSPDMSYNIRKHLEEKIFKAFRLVDKAALFAFVQTAAQNELGGIRNGLVREVEKLKKAENTLRFIDKISFDKILTFRVKHREYNGEKLVHGAFCVTRDNIELYYDRVGGLSVSVDQKAAIRIPSMPHLLRIGKEKILLLLGDKEV